MTTEELDDRLAELVASYGLLTPQLMDRARAFQTTRHCTLGAALHDLHLLTEDVLRPLLQELTGVRAVNPSLMTVYPDFIERISQLLPPEVVRALSVFPAQMEINAIHVCMLNPTDGWTTRALEALSGCRVVPLISHEAALREALRTHYPALGGGPSRGREAAERVAEDAYRQRLAEPLEPLVAAALALVNRNRDKLDREGPEFEAMVRDPAMIRLAHQLIARSIEAGASDVHVEPGLDGLRIRARIDGAMQSLERLPPVMAAPLVGRLKAMAGLPIGRARAPLDARIGYELVWGRGIDLRFSLVPAMTGESVVLRVIDRSRGRLRIETLGMDDSARAQIEAGIGLPNGLLLVTGPTGSGKSATLYALLDRLNRDDRRILTAEDPVESRIPGVTQVQCGDDQGLRFADVLRSFLRQDPDVLMVGEIRDAETADVSLKAALTGHLVLSSLHTNDAPGAILRLLNMQLEPFLVASALRLVIAQRLIRRLCVDCRRPVDPDSDETPRLLALVEPALRHLVAKGTLHAAAGCPRCAGSGYRGRTGIFEVLRVTDAIEALIVARAGSAEIRTTARREGMRTLREAALLKVAAGETSVAEALEHTVETTAAKGEPNV